MRRLGFAVTAAWLAVGSVFLSACKVGDGGLSDGGLFRDRDSGGTAPREDGAAGGGALADTGQSPEADAGGGQDAAVGQDGGAVDLADAGGDSGSRISIREWPSLLGGAICDALEACLGVDLLEDALRGRDCATLRQNRLENSELAFLAESVESGRLLFFPEDVAACLDEVRALGCDVESARLPAGCELALLGTVPINGECAVNEECEGDAFCEKQSDGECPGTCRTLREQGDSCTNDDDAQCQDGLICFAESTCEPLGHLGVDCGAAGDPACAPGLLCLDQGDGPKCGAVGLLYTASLGDDCDVAGPLCERGLVCESVAQGSMGVCAERVGMGQPCKRAEPNQCPMNQYCDAEEPGESGVCQDLPVDGEPCLQRGSQPVGLCADRHVCIAGQCHALQQVGGACTDDDQCYSRICDGSRCTVPLQCIF